MAATDVPTSCSVLVIGGGPGGSYAASVLAREGTNTVLFEADTFPRYHIGESMLPSFRYFMRFIDLEDTFDNYGFVAKKGAAFKMHKDQKEGYTDFIAANGPKGYAWNVVRSESDHIIFKHAAASGAKTFDGTRVDAIQFESTPVAGEELPRPVSATWSRKEGSTGTIKFDYLVDASGRAGLVSTKYMKNRKFNQGLKNLATWGYWKGVTPYGVGSEREGQPFFEALTGMFHFTPKLPLYGSGWCWNIPLHDGTMSIGVVMRQDIFTERKKSMENLSGVDFYRELVKMAPTVEEYTKNAELVSGTKSASDWSYSASAYSAKNVRIVGDAGCFIDPYFSSGVHLALSSALSAAVTIQASRNGECDESVAAAWHNHEVMDSYQRFLFVVITALRQIADQRENILNTFNEDGFDEAFSFFRPIIQGTADSSFNGKPSKEEVLKTLEFCASVFHKLNPEQEKAITEKLEKTGQLGANAEPDCLTEEEKPIWRTMKARKTVKYSNMFNTSDFSMHEFSGLAPRLLQGSLGLNDTNLEALVNNTDVMNRLAHEQTKLTTAHT